MKLLMLGCCTSLTIFHIGRYNGPVGAPWEMNLTFGSLGLLLGPLALLYLFYVISVAAFKNARMTVHIPTSMHKTFLAIGINYTLMQIAGFVALLVTDQRRFSAIRMGALALLVLFGIPFVILNLLFLRRQICAQIAPTTTIRDSLAQMAQGVNSMQNSRQHSDGNAKENLKTSETPSRSGSARIERKQEVEVMSPIMSPIQPQSKVSLLAGGNTRESIHTREGTTELADNIVHVQILAPNKKNSEIRKLRQERKSKRISGLQNTIPLHSPKGSRASVNSKRNISVQSPKSGRASLNSRRSRALKKRQIYVGLRWHLDKLMGLFFICGCISFVLLTYSTYDLVQSKGNFSEWAPHEATPFVAPLGVSLMMQYWHSFKCSQCRDLCCPQGLSSL
ncbi:hypothetical protein AAMO2058_001169500 [Amorphochlora amoebiformis]